ncbi:MAG: hypothetical protein ABIG63_06905 [Chloroflexota bacterium]
MPYESAMLDGYPIQTDSMGLWKNKFFMSAKESCIFESIAGETLLTMGYELSVEKPALPPGLAVLSILDDIYRQASNRVLRQ